MEFLTDYKKKMNKHVEKYQAMKHEIEELQATSSLMAQQYQDAVENTEFDKADDLIKKMNQIESDIKIKSDMAAVIKERSKVLDPADAAKIKKNFIKYRMKRMDEKQKLEKEIAKKKEELLTLIHQAAEFNFENLQARNTFNQLPYEWGETKADNEKWLQTSKIKREDCLVKNKDIKINHYSF